MREKAFRHIKKVEKLKIDTENRQIACNLIQAKAVVDTNIRSRTHLIDVGFELIDPNPYKPMTTRYK